MVMVYMGGSISGAAYNPAVTLALTYLVASRRYGTGQSVLPSLYIGGMAISFLVIANHGRDVEDLRQKLEAAGMTQEVKGEALRELNRLQRMSPVSPEYGLTRTYLEWMASLPWNVSSGSQVDVKRAAEILGINRKTLYRMAARFGIDLKGGSEKFLPAS